MVAKQIAGRDSKGMKSRNRIFDIVSFLMTVCLSLYYIGGDFKSHSKALFYIHRTGVTFFGNGDMALDFFSISAGMLLAGYIYYRYIGDDHIKDAYSAGEETVI